MKTITEIQHRVIEMLEDLLASYSFVNILIGTDKNQDKVLVSYSLTRQIDDDSYFWEELMHIEDSLTQEYSELKILFCEDESLFKISGDVVRLLPLKVLKSELSLKKMDNEESHLVFENNDNAFYIPFPEDEFNLAA